MHSNSNNVRIYSPKREAIREDRKRTKGAKHKALSFNSARAAKHNQFAIA